MSVMTHWLGSYLKYTRFQLNISSLRNHKHDAFQINYLAPNPTDATDPTTSITLSLINILREIINCIK